jgi:stalled ribosome rescue protein Dom34
MGKRSYKRGYPVAVLIGFEEGRAVLWRVFSEVIKPCGALTLCGLRADGKALYRFHETVVDALRPVLREGVKGVVVVAPVRTDFAQVFLDHVRKHHAWLFQAKGSSSATFGVLVGSAGELHEVADLVKTKGFNDLINETTSTDADRFVDMLEKGLNNPEEGARVMYSLEEIEDLVYSQSSRPKVKPEYLMVTNEYLLNNKERNRINRLLQISNNRKVKTVIVDADTPAGKRLVQLGGMVCLARPIQAGKAR